jgi:hypothetical protein
MNKVSIATTLFATAIAVVAVCPKAVADEHDKKTVITISEPMEVPGVVLAPGTYVFKLVESQSDRNIVTITNERGDHTFATIIAINNYRLRPTSKSSFGFWEVPAGAPKALRAWFYPGDNFGQEFRYPKTRATEIAQTTHEEVPAEPAPAPAVVAEAPAPQPEPTVVAEVTPPPPAPEPAPVAAAPAPEPAPVVVAENTTPATLPQTASNIPLLALLGFLSVGTALGLGAIAKRQSVNR